MVGRRRGDIESLLRRIAALPEEYRDYKLIIIERGREGNLREIGLEELNSVGRDYAELRDGTVIPYHRIIGLKSPDGRIRWLRGARRGEGGTDTSAIREP